MKYVGEWTDQMERLLTAVMNKERNEERKRKEKEQAEPTRYSKEQ